MTGKSHTLRILAAGAALLALVLLAAGQSRRLARYRHSGPAEAPVSFRADVPPALGFVVVGLGGFRGVLSEILWFRAARLQEQGRYLELVQLSRWITLLDPHAPENWAYNAWNLAYNISVMMNRPEDRLRWVKSGLSLLRDDAIPCNPREASLYRELSWLYQNKIGSDLDSAHRAYQFDLAQTMAPLLHSNGTARADGAVTDALAALRLDPGRMLALEKRFGPLDWRLANTHALYWACEGLPYAAGPEKFLCRQAVVLPLIRLMFEGRFTGSLPDRRWATAERPDLAPAAADCLIAFGKEDPSDRQLRVTRRFLTEAIRMAARHRDDAAARLLYSKLLPLVPADRPRPTYESILKGKENTP